MARSWTVPDLYDEKSRAPWGARVRAHRCDTHTYVEEQTLDAYGNATFTTLPEETDVSFHAIWGGTTADRHHTHHRWFFSHIATVSEGGTGAGDVEGAQENLGIHEAAMLWALVL